jgi:hypothetical protein
VGSLKNLPLINVPSSNLSEPCHIRTAEPAVTVH